MTAIHKDTPMSEMQTVTLEELCLIYAEGELAKGCYATADLLRDAANHITFLGQQLADMRRAKNDCLKQVSDAYRRIAALTACIGELPPCVELGEDATVELAVENAYLRSRAEAAEQKIRDMETLERHKAPL